jgi:hypothetical protein
LSSGPDYSRSKAKADAIRAQLEPLAPGERPLGLRLAIALVVVIGLANVIAAAANGNYAIAALTVALAAGFAVGLWRRHYVTILLFEALLALTIVFAALSLLFAGNLLAVLVAVGLVVLCAPVFWLLVRVMARLQVPPR